MDYGIIIPSGENVICYIPLAKQDQFCYYNFNENEIYKLGLWLNVKCSGIEAPKLGGSSGLKDNLSTITNSILP